MINNEGKEMINDYAVKNEVFVGNRRYLFAVHTDEKEPQRFLKCQCYPNVSGALTQRGLSRSATVGWWSKPTSLYATWSERKAAHTPR